MALAQIDVTINDAADPNSDEQDILFGPAGANPPTDPVLTNAPLSTSSVAVPSVVPGTYYAQRVLRNSATGEETRTVPAQVVVEGPTVTWVTPSDGASLTEGYPVTLAVDVTANAHPGIDAIGGLGEIRFEYSTDGGSTFSTIGTSRCDDTSSPQAVFDWGLSAGVTNLRAVCVDTGGAEVGVASVISIQASPNQPPVIDNPIGDVTGVAGDPRVEIDLVPVFSDPEGGELTYSVVSGTTASINGQDSLLYINLQDLSQAITETVQIRAFDPAKNWAVNGSFVVDEFTVTVTAS